MSMRNWTKEERDKIARFLTEVNPCNDTEHLWVRTGEDVMTFYEATHNEHDDGYDGTPDWNVYPDFTGRDLERTLSSGSAVVYSSYPIRPGTFVSTSKLEAKEYAGSGKVYSKKVSLDHVAWVGNPQGMYIGNFIGS